MMNLVRRIVAVVVLSAGVMVAAGARAHAATEVCMTEAIAPRSETLAACTVTNTYGYGTITIQAAAIIDTEGATESTLIPGPFELPALATVIVGLASPAGCDSPATASLAK